MTANNQYQTAYMCAQAERKRQINQDLTNIKQVLETITCDKSTACSESSTESSEIVDIETSEEVSINLTVPVFESASSGERFVNKPSRAEKTKNKILKPIQEEDCEDVTHDRQLYKDMFKKVRKAMKTMDIKVGKNPLFLSSEKLARKAQKLIK